MGTEAAAAADDKGGDRGDKKRSMGRRKQCKFCGDEALKIDYKDAGLLKYFITDRGKLVPRRLSCNCAKHQREIAVALAEKGVKVDSKKIHLAEPLKALGMTEVSIKLGRGVAATVKVWVVKKEA